MSALPTITVNDRMQQGYTYSCEAPMGGNFHPNFTPDLTPKQCLSLGIFGGKYMTDCQQEFPSDWFTHARLCATHHEAALTYFKVNASLPLSVWRKKGWIYPDDPRGWFQWYCRYFMGRRLAIEDIRQINRWRKIRRHIGAIQKNCIPGDVSCRPTQRQALLHWAYDSRYL